MAKLNKIHYYTSKREKKLNCYYITITKELVEKLGLEDKELQIRAENDKIIIEKVK